MLQEKGFGLGWIETKEKLLANTVSISTLDYWNANWVDNSVQIIGKLALWCNDSLSHSSSAN